MKLAFSTNAYTKYSLIEALEGIKRAGYAGAEILADVPHAYPMQMDESLTSHVQKALERLGLAVSNINCNCSFGYWKDAPPEPYFEPSVISPNPKHRADRIAMIQRSLQFARDIGARNISVTSGRMLPGMPPEKAARQFAESIKPLLDHADRLGVDLGIECEPGLYLEYVAELREWINRLNHRRLGANLDIGHSQVIGETIPYEIEMLRGRIWNMHVEDIPNRKHYHMIPGEGTLDWHSFKSALDRVGYDRFLTVELYTEIDRPQEAAEKSIQFLSAVFHGA
jgi:sugar phosphate isomerase/epimerase